MSSPVGTTAAPGAPGAAPYSESPTAITGTDPGVLCCSTPAIAKIEVAEDASAADAERGTGGEAPLDERAGGDGAIVISLGHGVSYSQVCAAAASTATARRLPVSTSAAAATVWLQISRCAKVAGTP